MKNHDAKIKRLIESAKFIQINNEKGRSVQRKEKRAIEKVTEKQGNSASATTSLHSSALKIVSNENNR